MSTSNNVASAMSSNERLGLKFSLIFDVVDVGKAHMDQVQKDLMSMKKAAEQATKAANENAKAYDEWVESFAKNADKKAEEIAKVTDSMIEMFHHAREGMREVQEMGHEIAEFGHQGLEVLEDMSHEVFHVASQFEALHAQMGFAFGADVERAFQNLKTFEQTSAYSMAEITESVAMLRSAFRGVDPTDLTARFRTQAGLSINALTALSDAAAGSRQNLGGVIMQVERAMEGNFRSLRYMNRLSEHEVTAMKTAMHAATTEQGRFDAIVQGLATHWGGAQAAVSNTFEFAVRNIKSIGEQLLAEFGEHGLAPIRDALFDLHGWLRNLINDREAMASIRSFFTKIGNAVGWVIHKVQHLGETIQQVVHDNPRLVSTLGTLWAVVSGGAVALGTFMASAAGAGLAITALDATAKGLAAAITTVTVAWGILTAVLGGALAVWHVVSEAYRSNFAGIRDIIREVTVFVGALIEAFRNWGEEGTTISEQTTQDLENNGLIDFFTNVVMWLKRAEVFGRAFFNGLSEAWDRIAPQVREAFGELSNAFREVGLSVRELTQGVNGFGDASEVSYKDAATGGRDMTHMITDIAIPAIKLMVLVIKAIAWTIEHVVGPAIVFLVRAWQAGSSAWAQWGDVIVTVLQVIAVAVGIVAALLAIDMVVALAAVVIATSPIIVAFLVIRAIIQGIKDLVHEIRADMEAAAEAVMQLPGAHRLNNFLSSHGVGSIEPPSIRHQGTVAPTTVGNQVGATLRADRPEDDPWRGQNAYHDVSVEKYAAEKKEADTNGGTARAKQVQIEAMSTALGPLQQLLQQMNTQQGQFNQMVRSGALRPVIGNDDVANAVRSHNESEGERSGFLARVMDIFGGDR